MQVIPRILVEGFDGSEGRDDGTIPGGATMGLGKVSVV
jgi:hypothetical protein